MAECNECGHGLCVHQSDESIHCLEDCSCDPCEATCDECGEEVETGCDSCDLSLCCSCKEDDHNHEGFTTNELIVQSQRQRLESFGLDPGMNLAREAADFYLLMSMKKTAKVKALANRLAPQMHRYLTMACLGEARYAISQGVPFGQVMRMRATTNDWKQFLAEFEMSAVVDEGRDALWKLADHFIEKYGHELVLAALASLFSMKQFKDESVGGSKWAHCAKTASLYGKISNVLFVDLCFGLQHNGCLVYNKAWDISGLQRVLELNVSERFEHMTFQASKEVGKLWTASKSSTASA